jgi:uncharacterized membrane protein YgcG
LPTPNPPITRTWGGGPYSGSMRSRLTTMLLVIAALALPGVMAAAVFYASSEAIGDTPAGLTPHFGGTAHPAAPLPAKTTVKRHRKPGLGAPTSTGTVTTDDHGGSKGGSGGGDSGGSGHSSGGGSDGGGDS